MIKAAITSHILDLQNGKPAVGVKVSLTSPEKENFTAVTDDDGRITVWDKELNLYTGNWQAHFDISPWFESNNSDCFYHEVVIAFIVKNTDEHYHIPLLLNSHGYSTYRGS